AASPGPCRTHRRTTRRRAAPARSRPRIRSPRRSAARARETLPIPPGAAPAPGRRDRTSPDAHVVLDQLAGLVALRLEVGVVGLELARVQRAEAVGVIGAGLAVVGGLDLVGAGVLADLEDLEVVQLLEDLGQRLGLDLEGFVHISGTSCLNTSLPSTPPPRRGPGWCGRSSPAPA